MTFNHARNRACYSSLGTFPRNIELILITPDPPYQLAGVRAIFRDWQC